MSAWPVAIYGSCVSRDLVPMLPNPATVATYVARQSIISAMTRPVAVRTQPALESAFQRRMVLGDVASDATRLLRSVRARLRFLFVDLVDERFGVLDLGDGRYITPSFEFANSGAAFQEQFPTARSIDFGTDEHWELWTSAAQRFARFLRDSGLRGKTRLLEAPFASHAIDGSSIPPFRQISAADWNQRYERYYRYLNSRGLVTIRLSPDEVHGDVEHRWGLAPYHYSTSASDLLIQRFIAARPSHNRDGHLPRS